MYPAKPLEIFTKIDPDVFRDPKLSIKAKFTYGLLCTYADNDNYKCFPSLKRLAGDLKSSTRAVDRWLKELVDAGVIFRKQRPKQGPTDTYIFHSEAHRRYITSGESRIKNNSVNGR